VVVAITAAAATAAATAGAAVIYSNIPSPLPGNLVSQSFEATQTSEFGGAVTFAGTARANPTVTVVMSSWGCQTGHWTKDDCLTTPGTTFTEPITLNIYHPGATTTEGSSPGSLIATETQTFQIPFRPSKDDTDCTGANAGKWYDAASSSCFNGLAVPITFNPLNITLPPGAVISVAYNTSGYGATPYGYGNPCNFTEAGCGYDSLNVGTDSALTAGGQPLPNDAYLNSSYPGSYCDAGNPGVGSFVLDTGCWTGNQPAIEVQAANPPTSTAQCKNGGWQNYTDANGTSFKNQGDCVSYVATGGSNLAAG